MRNEDGYMMSGLVNGARLEKNLQLWRAFRRQNLTAPVDACTSI